MKPILVVFWAYKKKYRETTQRRPLFCFAKKAQSLLNLERSIVVYLNKRPQSMLISNDGWLGDFIYYHAC